MDSLGTEVDFDGTPTVEAISQSHESLKDDRDRKLNAVDTKEKQKIPLAGLDNRLAVLEGFDIVVQTFELAMLVDEGQSDQVQVRLVEFYKLNEDLEVAVGILVAAAVAAAAIVLNNFVDDTNFLTEAATVFENCVVHLQRQFLFQLAQQVQVELKSFLRLLLQLLLLKNFDASVLLQKFSQSLCLEMNLPIRFEVVWLVAVLQALETELLAEMLW